MYLELAGSHHCDSEEQLRETEEHEAKSDPADPALDARIGPGVTVRVNPERSLKAGADRVAKSALPSGRPHLPPNGERRGEDVQEPVPKRCTPDQDEADADGSIHAHTVDDATMRECSLLCPERARMSVSRNSVHRVTFDEIDAALAMTSPGNTTRRDRRTPRRDQAACPPDRRGEGLPLSARRGRPRPGVEPVRGAGMGEAVARREAVAVAVRPVPSPWLKVIQVRSRFGGAKDRRSNVRW
jgi:hypothetical protein